MKFPPSLTALSTSTPLKTTYCIVPLAPSESRSETQCDRRVAWTAVPHGTVSMDMVIFVPLRDDTQGQCPRRPPSLHY